MKDSKLDPLLNELLCGEETVPCRASSLNQMLESARRRQRQRQWRPVAVSAGVPAALALGLFLTRPHAPAPKLVANVSSPVQTAPAGVAQPESASVGKAVVHFISDDELLSMFPGRPVALIGAPGHEHFVFLDQQRGPPLGRESDAPGARQRAAAGKLKPRGPR